MEIKWNGCLLLLCLGSLAASGAAFGVGINASIRKPTATCLGMTYDLSDPNAIAVAHSEPIHAMVKLFSSTGGFRQGALDVQSLWLMTAENLRPLEAAAISRPVAAQTLKPEVLHSLLVSNQAKNYIIFDVRNPLEVKAGKRLKIEDVVYLPLGDEDQSYKVVAAFEKFDHKKPAIVVSQKGDRSTTFATLLARTGFPGVFILEGGLDKYFKMFPNK